MGYLFTIADWEVSISFVKETEEVGIGLLPSFANFKSEGGEAPRLFDITVDQDLQPIPESQLKRIKVCDTGNGDIVVDQLADGSYQYQIRNFAGADCALLLSNADMTHYRCKVIGRKEERSFGLNNSMMLAYAFAGSTRGTLLIHASLVRQGGYGYAFVAKSGTGKSTQTANWLKVIPGCDLMNDDNPVLRIVDGEAMIYGSPWSGKTPCYRQVKAPLGAVTQIVRDPENWVEPISPLFAFSNLIAACSLMKWDRTTYRGVCDTVTAAVSKVSMYNLHCTADPHSAEVCFEAIAKR